jgi:8-hydroxy-5-deazaflavin:NADPH oxidoreductase
MIQCLLLVGDVMKIGILGTGNVAGTLARRWLAAGHQVTFGSRDPAARGELGAPVASLSDAVAGSDVVVNATPGTASLALIEGIGAEAFAGKVVIDVANATTASFELAYPNSSLAEKLQAALPGAMVVKTMNTAAMTVMTEPASLPPSSVFVSGDDLGPWPRTLPDDVRGPHAVAAQLHVQHPPRHLRQTIPSSPDPAASQPQDQQQGGAQTDDR